MIIMMMPIKCLHVYNLRIKIYRYYYMHHICSWWVRSSGHHQQGWRSSNLSNLGLKGFPLSLSMVDRPQACSNNIFLVAATDWDHNLPQTTTNPATITAIYTIDVTLKFAPTLLHENDSCGQPDQNEHWAATHPYYLHFFCKICNCLKRILIKLTS